MFCAFCIFLLFFCFNQKTAYEMRISDWSSDVCSSDLRLRRSLNMSQATLAEHCGLTQGHMSRVLREELEPGRKTEEALRVWLVSTEPGSNSQELELKRIDRKSVV